MPARITMSPISVFWVWIKKASIGTKSRWVVDILQVYLKYRQAADTDFGSETFAEVVDRIGIEPFKEYVYRDKSEQPVEG